MCCIKIIRDCVYSIIFLTKELYHDFTYIETVKVKNSEEVTKLISGTPPCSPDSQCSDSVNITIEEDDDVTSKFEANFDFEMVDI